MRTTRMVWKIATALSLLGLAACAPQGQQSRAPGTTAAPTAALPETSTARTQRQQQLGDEYHPRLLKKYGGAYDNPRLTAYVNSLGRELAAVSEQPNEKWTFTVLDNPTVNAFAIPGGYVYVTRGLVALANSEAELAGVIGHEIGHVTAGHSTLRQERATIAQGALLGATLLGAVLGVDPNILQQGTQIGQVVAGGFLADYSRDDELAADNLGIRYLARAGYDPFAQADFLESMGRSAALDARMAGRSYNPNATNFLASHPANGPRTRQAIEVARSSGEPIPEGAPRNRDQFLRAIDGITFGDSAKQGFVRGRTFSHPKLRFTYTSPQGFRITNSSAAVIAKGPDNARFVLDGGANPNGRLDTYIRRTWIPEVAKRYRTGDIRTIGRQPINGLDAATAELPVQINNQVFDALLVAIRSEGRLYRLTGLAPQGSGLMPAMRRAAATFRALSVSEANGLREQKLRVATVRRGDTIDSLARSLGVEAFQTERFRVLNDLPDGTALRAGDRVKVVE